MGNRYQQAFYEIVESIEGIQASLGKARVANTPKQHMVNLSDVWKQSMEAQSDLTDLPITHRILMRTSQFLSQTGDYAYVLSKKNAGGQGLSSEEINQLEDLQAQAAELAGSLQEAEEEVMQGDLNWAELINRTGYQIADDDLSDLDNKFDGIRENLDQYPTLVYDGPFSDHIGQGEAKAITGEDITREQAKEIARDVLDERNVEENLEIIHDEKINGRIPAYSFRFENENKRYCVDISEQGGYLINIVGSQNAESEDIDLEEAQNRARKYLAEIGYDNMVPTSDEIVDNIAYISLAYREDDIIYYPDLINVQVALDEGQIIGVEALSYLISHHQRSPEEPELTEEEVREIVNLDTIENIRPAVIPTDGKREILVYEVKGSIGEGEDRENYLIYINADNGIEEEIFHIIETERGTLTI